MSRFRCQTAILAALAVQIALPATAQQIFAPPRPILEAGDILGALWRGAVQYARLVVDLRYEAFDYDSTRNVMTLRGLRIDNMPIPGCRIGLDRVVVSGVSLWGQENSAVRFDLRGLNIETSCFQGGGLMLSGLLGGNELVIDSLTVDLRQSSGQGETQMNIALVSENQFAGEFAGEFDYFAVTSPLTMAMIADELLPYDRSYDQGHNRLPMPPRWRD